MEQKKERGGGGVPRRTAFSDSHHNNHLALHKWHSFLLCPCHRNHYTFAFTLQKKWGQISWQVNFYSHQMSLWIQSPSRKYQTEGGTTQWTGHGYTLDWAWVHCEAPTSYGHFRVTPNPPHHPPNSLHGTNHGTFQNCKQLNVGWETK